MIPSNIVLAIEVLFFFFCRMGLMNFNCVYLFCFVLIKSCLFVLINVITKLTCNLLLQATFTDILKQLGMFSSLPLFEYRLWFFFFNVSKMVGTALILILKCLFLTRHLTYLNFALMIWTIINGIGQSMAQWLVLLENFCFVEKLFAVH